MDWEKKRRMVWLGNQDGGKKELQAFVTENVDEFDNQAWDMLSNMTNLVIDEMKEDIDYWKEIYPRLIKVDASSEELSFRGGMRVAMMQTICEEELNLKDE